MGLEGTQMTGKAEFDQFAEDYDNNIGPMISITGENREFFSNERIAWLARRFRQMGYHPSSLLDFGCGTGIAAPGLVAHLNVDRYLGVDVSLESLHVARKNYNGLKTCNFLPVDEFRPAGQIDTVFTNGVFHHIPPDQRANYISYIYEALKPGGMFAFYEYNPVNPLLLLGMKLSPVDKNAVPLTPWESRKLLKSGNFTDIQTHFIFFFPKPLERLRKFEPKMSRIPLGAQYVMLARKK